MEKDEIIQNAISSGLFVICWFILRYITYRSISNWKFKEIEHRRRWNVEISNGMFIALVIGLMLIWASALKTFALSIVVIASAIAIGCKEYIMCFLGGILKASSNYFSIGDRIIIGSQRGDVINHTLFTTTLFEVGPDTHYHQYTGRKIIIPNSLLLTTSVTNETGGGKYALHSFKVAVPRDAPWKAIAQKLSDAATQVCADYIPNAQQYFNAVAQKRSIEAPSASPRVIVSFHDYEKVELVIRIPVLVRSVGKMEQEILARTFAEDT